MNKFNLENTSSTKNTYDWDTNEIVEAHLLIGDISLQSFKKIIKFVLYPTWPRDVYLEIAKEVINAYTIMGGSQENILELKVYSIECLIHYTLDTYDLDDELYLYAEEMFGEMLTILTTTYKEYFSQFKSRLESFVLITSEYPNPDRYSNHLDTLWQKIVLVS